MLIPEPKAAKPETLISESKASKFNAHKLKKLQAAIEENPEVDLTTKMPTNYSARLARFQKESHNRAKEALGKPDKRPQLRKANDSIKIMRPLSPAVLTLLEGVSEVADPLPGGLSQQMLEVTYKSNAECG